MDRQHQDWSDCYRLFSQSYNTPQKLDRGIRCMLACHTKEEARYGKKHAQRTQWGF
jgi:hypothetical protein